MNSVLLQANPTCAIKLSNQDATLLTINFTCFCTNGRNNRQPARQEGNNLQPFNSDNKALKVSLSCQST